jgi:hypothetical protein
LNDNLPIPVVAFGGAIVVGVGVWGMLRIAETGHFVLAFAALVLTFAFEVCALSLILARLSRGLE